MDIFFLNNEHFAVLAINDYPVLMVFWNLFLLIVPFFLFIVLVGLLRKSGFKKVQDKLIGVFLFLLWVLFIPNTAYVITDVRHLLDYCPADSYSRVCAPNAWMIMFFFMYSLLGWVFFTVFLAQMKGFIKDIFGAKISNIFVILIIPMISLGVLIGLVDRFNSWDVFLRPLAIFENMLVYITSFYYFRNFLIFTIGLYFMYFLGDFLFKDKFKRYG